jgi:PPOX class probable F420-dependent enzyme
MVETTTNFRGKYLSLTSYKRDGTAVATPVWFIEQDGRLLVQTDLGSGKVKRIRANPVVSVALCNGMGHLRGEQVKGRAEVLVATETARIEGQAQVSLGHADHRPAPVGAPDISPWQKPRADGGLGDHPGRTRLSDRLSDHRCGPCSAIPSMGFGTVQRLPLKVSHPTGVLRLRQSRCSQALRRQAEIPLAGF